MNKTTFDHFFSLRREAFFVFVCVLFETELIIASLNDTYIRLNTFLITLFSLQVEMCHRKETEMPQGWGVNSKGLVRDHVVT